jgi:two-component system NtrC family response regulator
VLNPRHAPAVPQAAAPLAAPGGEPMHHAPAAPPSLGEAEKQAIIDTLALYGGHRQKTADALNISRRTLQYKLKKYGLTTRS